LWLTSHHFAAGVHAELRHPRINAPDAGFFGYDWADRGAARAIVSHHEFLQPGTGLSAYFANDHPGETVRRVPLVGVRLDDHARVHARGVSLLVLRSVVGVDGMSHVDAAPSERVG